MAAVIGALRAELAAQIAEFVKGFDKAGDHTAKFAKRFRSVAGSLAKSGAILSASVTAPLVALGKSAFESFSQSENAVAAFDQAMATAGKNVGSTSAELQTLASQLQKVTTFGDEDILGGAIQSLLKFTNLSGQQFRRTIPLVLDLAQTMQVDLKTAAETLGKALNDPVKGLRQLRTIGISFSEEQTKVLKQLVATGQTAKAQGMILDEVSKRFGGAAEAAAKTTTGQLTGVANQWDDLKEKLGAILAQVLPPLIEQLGKLVDWLNTLDPVTLQWAVTIGAVATAIGPVLVALGGMATALASLPAIIGGVTTAVGVLLGLFGGPVTLAIAAVAGLAAAWILYGDQIIAKAKEIYAALDEATGGRLTQAVDGWTQHLKGLASGALSLISGLIVNGLKALLSIREKVPLIVAALTELKTQAVQAVSQMVSEITAWLTTRLSAAFDAALSIQEKVSLIVAALTELKTQAVQAVSQMVSEIETWLKTKLGAAFDFVKGKIDAAKGWFRDMYNAVVGQSWVPDMIDGIARHFSRLDAEMVGPAREAASATEDAFSSISSTVSGLLRKLLTDGKLTFDDLRQAAADLASSLFIQPFTSGLSSAFGGSGGIGSFFSNIFSGFFAGGGVIPRGTFGIVGEHGPEPVFAGRGDLTVMPNSSLGGRQVVVNQYISTPDPNAFRLSQRQIARRAKQQVALA